MERNKLAQCKACGFEIAKNANNCPSCGAKNKKPLHKGWWFIIIIAILTIGVLGNEIRNTDFTIEQPERPQEQTLAEKLGISETALENITVAYNAIGIDDISGIVEFDLSAYRVNYEGHSFVAIMDFENDEVVDCISSGVITFYENETALFQADDRIVTADQKIILMYPAETAIKDNLKSPSSAKFPGKILESDKWKVSRDKSAFYIQSYVDSQNSFGATIRTDFIVEFLWSGDIEETPIVVNVSME